MTDDARAPKIQPVQQVWPINPQMTLASALEIGGRFASIDGILARKDGNGEFPEKKDSV
ncbi:MAG: hypothetical protein WCJ09_28495 [Planctomycetota bacterium]